MTARTRRSFNPNSQLLYAETLEKAIRGAARWLDLGCGHDFLPRFATRPLPLGDRLTVGIDLDAVSLRQHAQLRHRIVADVERLPLASESFDLVTANMVLEHVRSPVRLFEELRRVLTPRGSFLFHTPNATGYTTLLTRAIPSALRPRMANRLQGRAEADVYPTFYRANSVSAITRLAAEAGLQVAELGTVTSSAQLYRVPFIGRLEDRFVDVLRTRLFSRLRPCILGRLEKPA
jgi:SAM-dependent methyltransferase